MKNKLATLGLVAFVTSVLIVPAQAFQSTQVSAPLTAIATTGGTKSASFNLALRTVTATEGANVTNVTWSGIVPGTTGWKIADTVMRLQWNVTDVNGGIQIYTDNTHAQATPRFVDPTPEDTTNLDSNPAGLLLVPPTGTTSSTSLPIAWSIKASSAVVGTGLQPADPDTGAATGAANRYQWLYMLDKNTPAIEGRAPFTNGMNFALLAKQSGIHGAQGPTDFFADPDKISYVYFQSNFSGAAAQSTYRTSRLTVEAFIE